MSNPRWIHLLNLLKVLVLYKKRKNIHVNEFMEPNFLLFCNLYCQFYLEKGAGQLRVDWSNCVSDHMPSCSHF